ncbi:hypothetical protein [Ilumatobacter sp.]|uniref:hypothetical protein n=1 Tax=Ilumatobacter sp. TaxID=1967498 RepID=UPI0030B309D6
MTRRSLLLAASLVVVAACSGGSDEATSGGRDSFVSDIAAAAAAVDAALGGPQEFFEITATPQLTNVFVAIDGGTAAVPYIYLDGELQAPAPRIDGAAGQTFKADAIDFDEATVLDGVENDLPNATIDAFSVEGGPGGFVRFVVSARSEQGGVLDIVVAPSGAVIEVNLL